MALASSVSSRETRFAESALYLSITLKTRVGLRMWDRSGFREGGGERMQTIGAFLLAGLLAIAGLAPGLKGYEGQPGNQGGHGGGGLQGTRDSPGTRAVT